HPLSKAKDVLRLFRDTAAEASDELMLFAGLLTGPDRVTELATIAACHGGSPAEAEAELRPVKEFGSPVMDVIGPMPYVAVNGMLDAAYPKGALNYWKSNFLAELSDDAISVMIDAFGKCP